MLLKLMVRIAQGCVCKLALTILAAFFSTQLVAAQLPALAIKRILGVDCVNVADAAIRLGFKGKWIAPGRRLALGDSIDKIEIEADSREIVVNGLHVFLGEPVVEHSGQLYVSKIDFERRLAPMLRPALLGPAQRRPRVIAIDPGHGGTDRGTENKRLGLMEKTFTLDVAFRLQKILEAGGYKTVLTRTTDVYVPLERRAEIANRAHADLFVSIHFNSLDPDTRTTGSEVYTFPPQFQRSTSSWSSHTNDSENEPAPVNRFDLWSAVLAHAMHYEVLSLLKTVDRGEKLKHLGVLRHLDCPGVLIESAFLSNDAEAKRIATSEFQQQIAKAIDDGVRAYVNLTQPRLPAPAPPETAKPASSPAVTKPVSAPPPASIPAPSPSQK